MKCYEIEIGSGEVLGKVVFREDFFCEKWKFLAILSRNKINDNHQIPLIKDMILLIGKNKHSVFFLMLMTPFILFKKKQSIQKTTPFYSTFAYIFAILHT